MAAQQADIGLVGLAVMGQNLVLNMNDNGFTVSVYNRTTSKVDDFLEGPAKGTNIIGCHDLKTFVASLKSPRRIMLMVKAGPVVDSFIEQLVPYLEHGDIIIDGGNSLYNDSDRRTYELHQKGILFVGTGVSGGEEGARHGPSIMPGGNHAAWPAVKPIFQAIAAQVNGEACCDWVGNDGAGHYVKMVHNGIEYGDMQLICEAYQLMREGLGMTGDEIQTVFADWNEGVLDSYLIEITRDILAVKEDDGSLLVDHILDAAGQKGTGKWTGMNALDLGIPLTLIGEAVFARCLSARKEERVIASGKLPKIAAEFSGDKTEMVNAIRDALYASKIISYAQGYMLMHEAADTYGWELNYGGIALMWRGGCIIRSSLLDEIAAAFRAELPFDHLILAPAISELLAVSISGLRRVVAVAALTGQPVPALSAALAWHDTMALGRGTANMIQAQRDFFGAHGFERMDGEGKHHGDWNAV